MLLKITVHWKDPLKGCQKFRLKTNKYTFISNVHNQIPPVYILNWRCRRIHTAGREINFAYTMPRVGVATWRSSHSLHDTGHAAAKHWTWWHLCWQYIKRAKWMNWSFTHDCLCLCNTCQDCYHDLLRRAGPCTNTYLGELRGHVSNIPAQMVRGHWVTKSSKAITTGSKLLI